MKKLLVALLILPIVLFNLSVTHASNIDENSKKLEEQVKIIKEHATTLNESQIKEAEKIIKESIKEQEILLNGKGTLDYKNANGYKFDETEGNIQTVTIPYKENKENEVSSLNNVTVAFDSKSHIKEYSEVKIEETSTHSKSTVYVNGKESGTATIEKTEKTETKSDGEFHTLGYLDNVNKCMNKYGVNPDTAALAISTCGLVCTVSLGTLCVPCLGTVGAAAGGVIVACFINP